MLSPNGGGVNALPTPTKYMTNEEIFMKALGKVEENGLLITRTIYKDQCRECPLERFVYDIIFSHDFAKAFWEEKHSPACQSKNDELKEKFNAQFGDKCICLPSWQYHLQQMVLEKEPLKYIEKFL